MYATKKYADLSKLSNGPSSTWDGTTNTMTWTGTSNNMISNFDFAAGDYKKYEKIVVSISGLSENAPGVRLQIKANGQEKLVFLNGNGIHENTPANFGFTAEDWASLEWIRVLGSNGSNSGTVIDADHPASAKINYVYLEKPTEFSFNDAGKAYLYPSDLTASTWGGISYDEATGVLTKSDTEYGGLYFNFGEEGYDFSNITHIEVNVDVSDPYTDIRVYANVDDLNGHTQYISNSTSSFTLNRETIDSNIKKWNLGFHDKMGSMKINYICFTSEMMQVYEGTETTMNLLPSYQIDEESGTYVAATTYTPAYRINEATNAAYFGVDWNGEQLKYYTDLTGYKSIRVYQSASVPTVRCFFFKADATGQQQFDFTWNSKGYYELDLATVQAAVNNLKLISIRPQQGQTSSVNKIVAVSETADVSYKLSGKGLLTSTATAALADANATIYDATGVTGTGVSLTPTNPNALFVANTGVLANASNVIVNGTCANLVLTDNYPFKAPADFTATSASYTTTINATAQAGTLCLPFAATLPTGVTAYALKYTSGDEEADAVPVNGDAISANIPVLINGSGEVEFKGSNVPVVADDDNIYEALTGVFEETYAPVGTYVLQNGELGVGFYKVATNDIKVKPFRAYLTAQNAGAALRIVYPGDATGIEAVEAVADSKDDAYYTLSGVRVSHPVKGLYIKNGKKVMVK